MVKRNEIKNSRFLSKEDVETPLLLTIVGCDQQNVAMESDPEEYKYVLHFQEHPKPLVLGVTNFALIEQITGEDDTDSWNGARIVLYIDRTVMYRGKPVGGIRARAPESQTSPQANETDVPF